jgi:hypothetical protein
MGHGRKVSRALFANGRLFACHRGERKFFALQTLAAGPSLSAIPPKGRAFLSEPSTCFT